MASSSGRGGGKDTNKETYSIAEATRISFTTQLRQLREDDQLTEVSVSFTLHTTHFPKEAGMVSYTAATYVTHYHPLLADRPSATDEIPPWPR
jgi:hypothetical protein